MGLPKISPAEAKRLMEQGATLVDVREADEHLRERIPGARHAPLSRLDEADLGDARVLIFHCKSGMRTQSAAPRLAAKAGGTCEAYIVDGGIDALRKAGVPVLRDARQPLEINRQVQIGAGSLGFVGTILGITVSPAFLVVPALVGAGLLFAGLTGFCGMARLLARAPWNRRANAQASTSAA